MTVWERAVDFFQEKQEYWQILGPFALLCTLVLTPSLDLLVVALIGLYLSARWEMSGCVYALILLAVSGLISHWLKSESHLWQLGVEGSMALAFFITALSFEESTSSQETLASQIKVQVASIQHLEEDLAMSREEATAKQIALEGKVTALQKELEETLQEKNSLSLLNEILRTAAARHVAEKKAQEGLNADRESLLEELNRARVEKEQTLLINESLARLHAKESLKAKEALERLQAVQQQTGDDALYRQLRAQFDEKSQLLHQARMDLFKAETQLQALKIERKEKEMRSDALPEELHNELAQFEEEISALQKENGDLQDLVTLLTGTSKTLQTP